MFPEETIKVKGVISAVANELYVNDITITEALTASPELILYVNEEYVIRTYEVLKRLQAG